jgi:hypothetical protein
MGNRKRDGGADGVDNEQQQAKAAGEALTVKKAPHRPGTASALGLRAGGDVFSL